MHSHASIKITLYRSAPLIQEPCESKFPDMHYHKVNQSWLKQHLSSGGLDSHSTVDCMLWVAFVFGQFHTSGVRIQVFKNKLDLKLYSVLWSWQVTAHRKINSSSLVTTMYSGGVSKKNVYFFMTENGQEGTF